MPGSSKLRKTGRRVVVVGGSMSGLLAGLLLRRAGWEVEIFERVESELAGRGAGIVAQPDLIETLRRIEIDTTDLGVEITTRRILDASGKLVSTLACPQVLTAWERVYRALRDAFPAPHYHRGRGVRGVEQAAHSVRVHLEDGGTIESELVVGADGLRSTIRQQCLPHLAPLYAGYVEDLAGRDFDPEVGRIDPDPAQGLDEIGLRHDARATAGELALDPLENLDLPACAPQQQPRQQAAHRATDDHDAPACLAQFARSRHSQ